MAALSVHPLLVTPTHYTGEPGYISDTEDAGIIETGEPGHTLIQPPLIGNHVIVGANMKEEL